MDGFTFQFDDAFEFARRSRDAEDVVSEEMRKGVDRTSAQGDRLTKQGTPVVTGTLRRSIRTNPATFAGGVAQGGWGSYGTNYVHFVEDGRRGIVAGPGKVLRFKPKGSNTFIYRKRVGPAKGKKMFANAAKSIQSTLVREMDGAVIRIINRMGGA